MTFPTMAASGLKQPTGDELPVTEIADPILAATTRIVTAWLYANAVAPRAPPGLIRDIHRTLIGLELDHGGGEPDILPPGPCHGNPVWQARWRPARLAA